LADIEFTDDLGVPAAEFKPDLKHISSLVKYGKSEALRLIVVKDLADLARKPLSVAAQRPISFNLGLEHEFALGSDGPEISLTPSLKAHLRATTKGGSNLFAEDDFTVPATVADSTAYVGIALQGGLKAAGDQPAGNLSFGFEAEGTAGIEYWKAFSTTGNELTFGKAAGEALSHFVLPATVDDLADLDINDACAVSGQGSLMVSGSFDVSAAPNPLASLDLPLNAGTVKVKTGVMAGISAAFTISGAYQIRVRRTSADAIELSVYKQHGTVLETKLSASAGVSVKAFDQDLIKALLKAISTDPNDDPTKKLFADGGLSPDEIGKLAGAIKQGIDNSLAASINLALSQTGDHQAAFQYEVRAAELDSASTKLINRALRGDLSGLTELERGADNAKLAPGVDLISSVLTRVHTAKTVLKLNLLGLVNFISVSELIRKSVIVRDPGTGSLTITDTTTGNQINAEVDPERRTHSLHRAVFESLMLTTAYRVSNAVGLAGNSGHLFHFAFHRTTKPADLAEYVRWFAAMKLISAGQAQDVAAQFTGAGPSTCLLRAEFDDAACHALYFDVNGKLWDEGHYLEIGRRAMQSLLNPENSAADWQRHALLADHWSKAVEIGASPALATLLGLQSNDALTLGLVRGDVATITWWADAMTKAGKAVQEMRDFLATTDPATLAQSENFAKRRETLHRKTAGVIRNSKARFDEPWGLLSLLLAAGSATASARLVVDGKLLQKPELTVAAGG